ncbi:hypothetical protein Sjap_010479 [Stephania japonica]|uniref:Extra-large guanine nucleotide-binding protein 1-like n=1 Tax=Stephania japonica TaxID=461633 RepID=A0AAP0JBP8_9MAGN
MSSMDEEEEIEYSFALEYSGPPLLFNDYDLPKALPIDLNRIPTASIVSLSFSKELILPVIHPIRAKECNKNKDHDDESPTSVILLGTDDDDSEVSAAHQENTTSSRPVHGRRVSFVASVDAESSDQDDLSIEEDNDVENAEHGGNDAVQEKAKRGLCYLCCRGNWLVEKEGCIVCNAKYCKNCVLRAMGSMPEGRKCRSCIGRPIDESRRGSLGRCSRMLKRMLSKLEIRQIMEVEKSCEVNQLHPECIFVNGQQLCQKELVLLQNCPNPPTRLKPGRFWYDKLSGFWGKEGQHPCKIISPHLNVGGHIMRNASNGNMKVVINNREITKRERQMLRLAGVQCAGSPSFWLDEYGDYKEEGQKNPKGNLWKTPAIKLICAALSLPTPTKIKIPTSEEVNKLVSGFFPEYVKQRKRRKLLLVGYNGSGTSTIYKQAKLLYKAEPFSDEELQNFNVMIQKNSYQYLSTLLELRERFEHEDLTEIANRQSVDQPHDNGHGLSIFSVSPKLKAFSEWLFKIVVSGNLEVIFPAANADYAPLVKELWKDSAIQASFRKARDLGLLEGAAEYFLQRVVDISRSDYKPSETDILKTEGTTSSNGIACMDFSFPHSALSNDDTAGHQHDPLLRYQLIRIHGGNLQENCKLLDMFEDVQLVIFCVALSDYDQFCDEGTGNATNKMLASRKLFESVVTHPTFKKMNFHLILNKFDMLEEKIEHIPLNKCSWFDDFVPLRTRHRQQNGKNHNMYTSLAEQAFQYVAYKFKRLFTSLTDRKLYVSASKGLERETVDETLKYSREVLKWEEERSNYSTTEISNFSTDASSSPSNREIKSL